MQALAATIQTSSLGSSGLVNALRASPAEAVSPSSVRATLICDEAALAPVIQRNVTPFVTG